MSSVDIVIPTFDASELILRCLQRLRDPAIDRITVVDDASTDGTAQAIAKSFPEVRVVELSHSRGLAHALNRGAEMGTAEFVLFLNNDAFPVDGAVTKLCAALRDDPHAASAGGRLVDPDTTCTQDSYRPRALPGLAGLAVRLTGIERAWPKNPWTGQHLRDPLDAADTTRTYQQPAGACLLVRRTVLEKVGGWDEEYWFWYEDVDLSRRLLDFGYALYVPSALFEHVGRASTSRWPRFQQHRRLYHGTLLYAQRHLPRRQQIVLAAVMAGTIIPRIAWLSTTGKSEASRAYRHLLGESWALLLGRALISEARDAAMRSRARSGELPRSL